MFFQEDILTINTHGMNTKSTQHSKMRSRIHKENHTTARRLSGCIVL